MKCSISGVIVLSVAGWAACGAALADGFALKGIDGSAFAPVSEREQVAAIHHRDGVQRMVVTTAIDLETAERAVWLLPVPGTGATVHVDVWDRFPVLRGRDPVKDARNAVESLFLRARAFSVFPFLVEAGVLMPSLSVAGDFRKASAIEQVDKYGVHVETISADSVQALAAHLAKSGVVVDARVLATMEPYVHGEHIIVAGWIASAETVRREFAASEGLSAKLGTRRPCLLIEFPTDRPFFPMRPTQAYGDAVVPLRLFISGMHRPAVANELQRAFSIRVYQRDDDAHEGSRALFGDASVIRYTVVQAELPASRFTEDLYFEPHVPDVIRRADLISAVAGTGAIPLLLLLGVVSLASYVSAGVAGLVMFGKWGRPAVLGLYMLLTFIGLAYFLRNHDLRGLSRRWQAHSEAHVRRRFAFWVVVFFIAVVSVGQLGVMTWLGA